MNSTGFVSSASPWIGKRVQSRTVCPQAVTRVAVPRMGLSVKTEPLPNSQVVLEISVGKEECSAAWDSVVRQLTKRASIDGFRKGKAPKQIVINQYGKETIKASACEEVIEKSIQKALKEGGIHAIGQAEVAQEGGVESVIASYDPSTPLTFSVKIDVWPEATLTGSYENLEIEAEEALFDESLVDKALEDLQKKEAMPVIAPDGDTAKLGQVLVADLVGYYRKDDNTKGDRLPDIADGKSIEVKMQEGQYMEGFVEGLIGASVGEIRDVNVSFREANPRKELAGVKAVFEVTVHAIQNIVLPELNDEFAKQVSESATLEELRATIRDRIGDESDNAQQKNINAAIDTELSSIVEVELPESLVENQVKNKFANMLSSFKDNGMTDQQVKAMVTKENYELYKSRSRGSVEKTLRVNFAISKIAKEVGLDVDPEEVENQMALVRAELKGQDFEEDKVRDQVEAQLERDLVLQHIKKTAKITFVPPKKEEEEAPKGEVAAQEGAQ